MSEPIIRQLLSTDAAALLHLQRKLDRTTTYMLLQPEERNTSIEDLTQQLADTQNVWFAVSEGQQLLGYLAAYREPFQKTKHTAYLVIGLLPEARGQGFGTQLFEYLFQWAAARQLHRLELTVITENKAAIALYRKQGFEIEGLKRQSLFMNNGYFDEYYMSKLL